MNCLVGGCGAGMKRGLAVGDISRSSRKQWFWMLKKYAPRVFASGKPKLQKGIWRLTGWPLWLVNGNGRCWPVGIGRNVLAVGKHWALGCWPAKPETKMPPAGKCAPRIFAPEKFALAFFVCRLNFVLLLSTAGAEFPGKAKQKR